MTRTILLLYLAVMLTACTQTKRPAKSEPPKTIKVHSTAFDDSQPIPKKFTEDGEDVSPSLAWDGVPEGTKELALICDDPDAPTAKPWVHWVLYKIPPTVRELSEGLPTDATLDSPIRAVQGVNSWPDGRTVGYRGPAPPPGKVHHYHFKLYALDRDLELDSGADTWNVNSIRSRLQRLLDWLQQVQPDVLCLQELKATDESFPYDAIREAGYHAAVFGQKTYNFAD